MSRAGFRLSSLSPPVPAGSGWGVGLSGPPAGQGQSWPQSSWPPAGCPASLSEWPCTGPACRPAQGGGAAAKRQGSGSQAAEGLAAPGPRCPGDLPPLLCPRRFLSTWRPLLVIPPPPGQTLSACLKLLGEQVKFGGSVHVKAINALSWPVPDASSRDVLSPPGEWTWLVVAAASVERRGPSCGGGRGSAGSG